MEDKIVQSSSPSKRQLLKLLGGAAGGVAGRAPMRWAAPVVAAVVIPNHAHASHHINPSTQPPLNPTGGPCGSKGSSAGGGKGSGGPTASDPNACCDSIRPANPAYPTDATYLAERCCAKPGKTDASICCDDNVADKTDVRYAEQCCDHPGRDASGSFVQNAQGEYLCCDSLDPNSNDYKNYCCQNKAKNTSGNPVKDSAGNEVCCEGTNKNPDFCCIRKEVTYSASIPRTRTNWSASLSARSEKVLRSKVVGNMSQLSGGISIPKWNPADGPLGEVRITVAADIDSNATFETTDNEDAVVTFTTEVELIATAPHDALLQAVPSKAVSKEVLAGIEVDGAGSDFWRIDELAAHESESIVVSNQSDLDQYYSGNGDLDLGVIARGKSSFASSGNFQARIDTFAAATITVTYLCIASIV